jgi:hypothetical protein
MEQSERNIDSIKQLCIQLMEVKKGINPTEVFSLEALEKAIYAFYHRQTNLNIKVNNFSEDVKYYSEYRRWKWEYVWKNANGDNQTKVKSSARGKQLVKRGSQYALIRPGNYIFVSDEDADNAWINLSYPMVDYNSKNNDEGFYNWVYGQYFIQDVDDLPLIVRFYLNFKPEPKTIVEFYRELLSTFNRWQIPFSFKYLNTSEKYPKADAGVLYVSQKYFQVTLHLLKKVHLKFSEKSFFNDEIPHFTFPILTGIGFAEDPISENALSFGKNWANKLAKIIFSIFEKGNTVNSDDILEIMHKTEGNVASMHLNNGSNYTYDLSYLSSPNFYNYQYRSSHDFNNYFAGAVQCAYELCREVIYINSTLCTWTSAYSMERIDKFILVDDSFKDGRAGIGLFLSLMFSLTKDTLFKKVAIDTLNTIIYNYKLDTDIWRENPDTTFWEGLYFTFKESAILLKDNNLASIAQKINTNKTTGVNLMIPVNTDINDMIATVRQQNTTLIRNNREIYNWMCLQIGLEKVRNYPSLYLAKNIMNNHLDKKRHYWNGTYKSDDDRFLPTLSKGLAGVGYFLLKVWSGKEGKIIPIIPFELLK